MATTKMNVFVVFISSLIIDISMTQWSPVGKSQHFTCIMPQNNLQSLSWLNDQQAVLYACDGFSCVPASTQVDDLYYATITQNTSTFTSVLTIKSVTTSQHNTSYFCQSFATIGAGEIKQYNLYVYDAVETPTCDNINSFNIDRSIALKCWTEKVFPDAVCTFYVITNGSVVFKSHNQSITYKNVLSTTHGYYRTECNNTVSVDIIGRGSHQFYVIMYPNIPINITEDMKSQSPYTTSIIIDYPKAALRRNCHFIEYIRENEKRQCTCYNNNTSFLPTQVRWSKAGVDDEILNFTTKRPYFQYNCTVSNRLNWTDILTYEGKVAYPPDIFVSILNTNMDICDEKEINILGKCSLTPSFPQPSVQVYINNVLLVGISQTESNVYTFNSTVTSSGIFNVTCYANNQAYSVNDSTSVLIKGPPEVPTIFKLVKDETFSSESTRKAIIMCQSRGGYPYSKKLYLICDHVEIQATSSDNVLLYINITRTPSEINCTCVVFHESKCLQNKTTQKITLFFPSDANSVQVNTAAIGVGVTLALVIIFLIIIFIIIIKRNKGNDRNQQAVSKKNKRQDYNNIQATTQYVNTEMHPYETANIKTTIILNEELPTTSINPADKTESSCKKAEKEDHPYDEVMELKK